MGEAVFNFPKAIEVMASSMDVVDDVRLCCWLLLLSRATAACSFCWLRGDTRGITKPPPPAVDIFVGATTTLQRFLTWSLPSSPSSVSSLSDTLPSESWSEEGDAKASDSEEDALSLLCTMAHNPAD